MADVTQSIDVRIKTAIESANAETSLRSLRGALKDLQSLAEEAAESNTGAFEELEAAVNRVEGRIGDASDRLRVMAGEPLERVRNGVGLLGEGIKNLDFTKATIGIDGLASGIKGMNIEDFGKGVESVAGSFVNLGKALISNPIFLLTTAITLIISNFDKLLTIGGKVGEFFKGLNVIVTAIKDTFIDLINYLGIVNTKEEELKESTFNLADANNKLNLALLDQQKAISALLGQGELQFEYERKQIELTNSRIKVEQQLRKEIEKRPELEGLMNQKTLEEAYNFAKKYKLILDKDQLSVLEEYFERKRGLEDFSRLSSLELDKKELEENHKRSLERIATITNEYQKKRQLAIENFNYEKELRAKENSNRINDINTQLGQERDAARDAANKATDEYQNALVKRNDLQERHNILISKGIDKYTDYYLNAIKNAQKTADYLKTIQDEKQKQFKELNDKIGEDSRKEDEKQREDEINRTKSHNKELRDLKLESELKIINNTQTLAKSNLDYNIKFTDTLYNQGIISLKDAEKNKQLLMDLYRKEEIKNITENYDKQIKLAEGNAKQIKYLEGQKQLAIKNLNLDTDNAIIESKQKVLKNDENVAKERERIERERIETEKQLNAANTQSAQQQAENTKTKINLLESEMRLEKKSFEEILGFRNEYNSRKKDLIMEEYADQGILLQQQRDAELLANESNTVNKEQKAFEIKQHYANLEKELRKDTNEQIRALDIEDFERKANLYKNYINMAVNLDSFLRDIQRIGLSETKKEEEKSARQRFVIQKIAGVLSVGIDTAVGVMKAVKDSPLTGGMPFSAFIIAQGAAAAAAIAAKQFTYGGGSGGGGSSISATAPTIGTPPTLNTSTSFNPSAFYGIGTQRTEESTGHKSAQRVYVLESDITKTQKTVQVQAERATLSGR